MLEEIKSELSNLSSYLYIKHPFYNSILTQFNIFLVSDEKSEKYKVYTDSTNLYIDTKFANDTFEIDKKLLFYYIFHEILHFILLHKIRSISKNQDCWNLACDITVDNVIEKDKTLKSLMKLPSDLSGVKKIYDESHNVSVTTEDIYEELLKNPPKKNEESSSSKMPNCPNGECESDSSDTEKEKDEENKQENQGNKSGDGEDSNKQKQSHLNNHSQWKEDNHKNDQNKTKEKVQEILLKAEQLDKMSQNTGGIGGELSEILSQLKESDRSIQDFIYNIVQNFKSKSQSFKRPDRRYLYQGLIAPGTVKDKKHFDILFYIDTSGSMSLDNISKILYNIFNMIRTLHSYTFDIIQSDDQERGYVTTISKENENSANELLKIKGRGGTEIEPLFEHLKKRRNLNEKKYDVCVVGTDFYIMDEDQKGLLKVDNEETLAVISFKNNCKKEYYGKYKNKFLI